MKATFVYPNQLYEHNPAFARDRKIFLIQDPLFFKDSKYKARYHKQKILLHLLSMEQYLNFLKKGGYDVEMVPHHSLKSNTYNYDLLRKNNINELHIVDVVDNVLEKRITKAAKGLAKIYWYDSPGFLLGATDVKEHFYNKKFHYMANFYKKQRRRFNILMDEDKPVGGKWSFDAENRKKLPKDIIVPSLNINSYSKSILAKNIEHVEKHFPSSIGNIDRFNYPINHIQAKNSFNEFLENKLKDFGTYEDAISTSERTIFHSILTPYLNVGLITPKEVLDSTLEFAKDRNIPINSMEGFIRQIIGWREFIRGVYVYDNVKQRTKNFWSFKDSVPKTFYNGNTGILPLDDIIKKCNDYAYAHHIERLMILGNIMLLSNFRPNSVYRYFMDYFIDAYDWVMVPNVYGMSQFADGGIMSTKPYISGSNYILKMSNYKRDSWCLTWDALYWNFIDQNREFFKKNHRMNMMVSMYDKKTQDYKDNYKSTVNGYKKYILD